MMMEINLLPHREARRAADLRETVAVLLLGLVVVGGGIFFIDKGVKSDLETAEANVAQHGRRKAEKDSAATQETRRVTRLDAHKREP